MNDDPDMAKRYRELYREIKYEREYDYNETARIHAKYDYLTDKDIMSHRKPTEMYNIIDEKEDIEEEIMSTELTDPAMDLIYKRYRIG
jgi:tryptophanyl-tRNA synthetase